MDKDYIDVEEFLLLHHIKSNASKYYFYQLGVLFGFLISLYFLLFVFFEHYPILCLIVIVLFAYPTAKQILMQPFEFRIYMAIKECKGYMEALALKFYADKQREDMING